MAFFPSLGSISPFVNRRVAKAAYLSEPHGPAQCWSPLPQKEGMPGEKEFVAGGSNKSKASRTAA